MSGVDVPYSEFIQELEKFVGAAQGDLVEALVIGLFGNTRLQCTLHKTSSGGRRRRVAKRLDDGLANTALSLLRDSKSEVATLEWVAGGGNAEIVFASPGVIHAKIERKDGVTTRMIFD